MSCAKVIPLILKDFPNASFAFAAARSVDRNLRMEEITSTQRYRIYCYIIPIKFGHVTFDHFAYDSISSYLLYNKRSMAVKEDLENMFRRTYNTLDELS